MLFSPIIISGVHPNPAGADLAEHNGEFVVLHNATDQATDVSGWTLIDAKNHVLAVPAGTVIGPRGQLRVYTGPGVTAPGRVYVGRGAPVFNNRQPETVQLRNGASILHTFRYTP